MALGALTNNPTRDPELVDQDDIQYASIQHQGDPRRVECSPSETAEEAVQYACVQASAAADEAQYATVKHSHKNTKLKKTQEDDEQYGNIRFHSTGAAYRLERPV